MVRHFNKKVFADLLTNAVGNRSINQYERDSGVSAAHISRLTRSLVNTPPSPQTIEKLASKAQNGVTYEDLMRAAGHLPSPTDYLLGNNLPVSTVAEDIAVLLGDTRKVPIYKLITENRDDIFAPENIIGWQPVPANIIAQRGFIIVDDCMSSKINKGDIVLIKSQSSFIDGQAVLAKLPDGSIIIRKATHTNDGVILSPDNPKYQPQVYEDKDVFIIGIVEKIITDYK